MATDLFDLAATISVNNAGVDAALTNTQRKVLELAAQFKAADAVIGTHSKTLQTHSAHVTHAAGQTSKFTEILRA